MNYNWKEIVKQKGRIDPATVKKAERVLDLTEKIEYHLNRWLNGTAEERLNSGKEARRYALEYKEATGEWYRRDWKDEEKQ